MSHIRIDQVYKTYPGNPPVEALKDIHLDIAPGEFVALLGPSGCGKSTLLNLVASFEPLTSGSLTVGGQAISAPGPDRGVVFQEAALFPWLSVWENVVFGPKAQGQMPSQYKERAEQMIEMVGLTEFKNHLPIQLSGGMRQRVGIARVLTLGSKVLLMDEPFGALDEITRHKLDAELLEIWRARKITVIFVTHSIHEAVFLSSRVVMMAARPGRIVDEIPIDEPYPRSTDFMVTPEFSRYAKRLQDSLHRASKASTATQ